MFLKWGKQITIPNSNFGRLALPQKAEERLKREGKEEEDKNDAAQEIKMTERPDDDPDIIRQMAWMDAFVLKLKWPDIYVMMCGAKN